MDAAGLRIEGLGHAYAGTGRVLADVALSIPPATHACLLGPSGGGKSTLLRLVAGLETPDALTRLEIAGRDVSRLEPAARGVALVPQDEGCYPEQTVERNVALAVSRERLAGPARRARIDEALEALGLGSLRERRAATLSGGQRQRVAAARVLARRSAVALLDEPLAHLDPSARLEAGHALRTLSREAGAAVLHVTHDGEEALRLADVVSVLRPVAGGGGGMTTGPLVAVEAACRRPPDAWTAAALAPGGLPMNLVARDGAWLGFRPEAARLVGEEASGPGAIGAGRVRHASPAVEGTLVELALADDHVVRVLVREGTVPAPGAIATVVVPETARHRFAADGDRARLPD